MSAHLSLPLTLTAGGRLATVPIDSQAEITQSVAVLVSTRRGERRTVPEYGMPDMLFGTVDVDEIADVIEDDELGEPRAAGAAIELTRAGEVVAVRITPPEADDDDFGGDVDAYDPLDDEED